MPAATVRIWNIHVTMHMVNFLSGEAVHITIMQRVATARRQRSVSNKLMELNGSFQGA